MRKLITYHKDVAILALDEQKMTQHSGLRKTFFVKYKAKRVIKEVGYFLPKPLKHKILKNNFFPLLLLTAIVYVLTLPQVGSQTMSPDDFWQKVKVNHPIARQAALLLEQGAQE